MANYSKKDPNCLSNIVFVGNVDLRKYTEHDARYTGPNEATAVLVIDIIAAEGIYVTFKDITLELEILAPADAQFVEFGFRNNYHWDVPDPVLVWKENVVPTSKLRIRWDESRLLSGPGNGLTNYVGLRGVHAATAFSFTAFASASQVIAVATTSNCALTISDLHVGESIHGYIG